MIPIVRMHKNGVWNATLEHTCCLTDSRLHEVYSREFQSLCDGAGGIGIMRARIFPASIVPLFPSVPVEVVFHVVNNLSAAIRLSKIWVLPCAMVGIVGCASMRKHGP